nr:1113_t:CDS:2 [Entrophospora candida]
MHKNKNDIKAIIIQVKNYKDKQSKNTMRRKAGPPLSPEIVFPEELEKCIGKNNLGIYLNIGQAYVEEPFIQPCFYDGKKVIFDTDPSRTITTHSQTQKLVLESSISWIDPFNHTKSFNYQQILHQMMFPTYGKKRSLDDENDMDI